MRFKEFLLKEGIGLGNLGSTIDKVFDTPQWQAQAGSYVSNDMANNPTLGLSLPSTDLEVPSIERTGKIKVLMGKRNPIYIELSDGTKASFTYDEWKRIKGEPALGKTMTIIFQRHPGDMSQNYSKIDKAMVLD